MTTPATPEEPVGRHAPGPAGADGQAAEPGGTHTHDDGTSAHSHAGEHPVREAAPPSEPVTGIMVDVGDGYGALVLYAGAEQVGLEPEIHPVGRPEARQHVWVLERATSAPAPVFAAVFPSLAAGRYAICSPGGEQIDEVDVTDGAITEARFD